MNASVLATVLPVATATQSGSALQGSSGSDDNAFSQALAQQALVNATSTSGSAQPNSHTTTRDDDTKKTKENSTHTGHDLSSEATNNDGQPLVWATLFIANESAGIRQSLSLDKQNSVEQARQPRVIKTALAESKGVAFTDVNTKKINKEALFQTRSAAAFAINPTISTAPHPLVNDQHQPRFAGSLNLSAQGSDAKSAASLGFNGKSAKPTLEAQLNLNVNETTAAPGRFSQQFAIGQEVTATSVEPDSSAFTHLALSPSLSSVQGSGSSPTSLTLSPELNVPLHSQQWGHELGRHMLSITQEAGDGVHHAELRLDPPELGPIRISLSLSENIVQAYIVSAHASVRSAIEQALPQLQQAFAQAGISLGQADVSDQGLAQQFAQNAQDDSKPQGRNSFGSLLENPALDSTSTDRAPVTRVSNPNALVDTFA